MRVAVPRPDVELPCAIFAFVKTKFIPRLPEPLAPLADDPLVPLADDPVVPLVDDPLVEPEVPVAPELPERPIEDIVSC
jgi:hypothetical protein